MSPRLLCPPFSRHNWGQEWEATWDSRMRGVVWRRRCQTCGKLGPHRHTLHKRPAVNRGRYVPHGRRGR